MDVHSFLQFAGTCFIFCLLAPVLPCLALRPRLRGRSFPERIMVGIAAGDGVMVVSTAAVLLLHGGTAALDLTLAAVYTAVALWAYRRRPWVIFTQFTKYSRRILLGVLGWKTILRDLRRGAEDKLLRSGSWGDRTFRQHSGEWLLTFAFVTMGATLFCLRRWDIAGLSDAAEKLIMEHGVSAAQGHPFRPGPVTFIPAMMCDCAAFVTRIEGYAVVRSWSFVITMQICAAMAGWLIGLDRKHTFASLMVTFLVGLVLISYFPDTTAEVPDNDTAYAMLSIRNRNRDHTWGMIAVDDSLGMARAYGTYYGAGDFFDRMQSAAGEEDSVTQEKAGDVFLPERKIYVCIDYEVQTGDGTRDETLGERAASLAAWAEALARIYPQNVDIVSDSDSCTLYLIRQDPANPLNLSTGSAGTGSDEAQTDPQGLSAAAGALYSGGGRDA